MSDYLAAQKAISLSYDSIFEVVSEENQKLQIATSGTVDLIRPDKIRTTRKSGFSDTETVFDGKTLSFWARARTPTFRPKCPARSKPDRPVARQIPPAAPGSRPAAYRMSTMR